MMRRFQLKGQSFVLRPAHSSDCNELLKLINHAFRYQDQRKGDVRINEAKLLDKINSTQFLLVEDDDGRVVACVSYLDGEFGLLAVNDTPLHNVRGLGLGRLLINECEKLAKSEDLKQIVIEIMDFRTELLPFYEKFDYQPAGFARDFGWAKTIRMIKKL